MEKSTERLSLQCSRAHVLPAHSCTLPWYRNQASQPWKHAHASHPSAIYHTLQSTSSGRLGKHAPWHRVSQSLCQSLSIHPVDAEGEHRVELSNPLVLPELSPQHHSRHVSLNKTEVRAWRTAIFCTRPNLLAWSST